MRFSTLQEYGVDKVFVLENGNTDSSQRNIVYLIQGEKAAHVQATAGVYFFVLFAPRQTYFVIPLLLARTLKEVSRPFLLNSSRLAYFSTSIS